MDYFELNPKGPIRKMSKGMKQKLAIICTFMSDPNIIILDEPTSGLDPLMQNRFIELILQAKKNGATILLSSHIFEEVEKSCDRTAIIRNGRLVTIENMNSLAQKKKKTYTVTFADQQAAQKFALDPSLPIQKVKGYMLKIYFAKHIMKHFLEVRKLDSLFLVNLSIAIPHMLILKE